MAIQKQEKIDYWDAAAIAAEKEERVVRTDMWRKAAMNWLAYYTERKARDFVVQTIENYVRLRRGAFVLDVGCGPGKWVSLFAESGFVVTGVDASPWMIRLAKKKTKEDAKGQVEFYVMNVAKLALPTNNYDLVNCVTVLQHIFGDEDWRNAVHGMVNVTKPFGHILIFEAAPSFILKKRTRHLRFRSMKDYTDEFRKAGAELAYWKATDLSFPITYLGLRRYAASFSKKVYRITDGFPALSPGFLSLMSRISMFLAKPIDYKLTLTPLGFLSIGKILLFRKVKA